MSKETIVLIQELIQFLKVTPGLNGEETYLEITKTHFLFKPVLYMNRTGYS